jgi:hypothetical protein
MQLICPIALRGGAQSCNNHAMTNNHSNPFDELDALLAHDDSCPDQSDNYRADCIHDIRDRDIRNLLITDIDDHPTADEYCESDIAPQLASILDRAFRDATAQYHETARHRLSDLLLSYSLCPMHHTDYAICFDDENPECATIRAYFPSHDT